MVQTNLSIVELGNMTVKGQSINSLITMAKSHKLETSKESHKARETAERMRAEKLAKVEKAKQEAKKLMFYNSAKYTTANKQAEKMLKPELKIIIRSNSKNFNHLHAVKTVIHEPQ